MIVKLSPDQADTHYFLWPHMINWVGNKVRCDTTANAANDDTLLTFSLRMSLTTSFPLTLYCNEKMYLPKTLMNYDLAN